MEMESRGIVGDNAALTAPAARGGKQRLWSLRDALATHDSVAAAEIHSRGPQISTECIAASAIDLPNFDPEMPGGVSETAFERLADGISSSPAAEMACLYFLGFNVPNATARVAGGLAKSLAGRGRTVLLVDGDLERGGLSHGVGQCEHRGLIEILNRSTLWRQTLYPTSQEGLTFLPVGRGALSRTGGDAARWDSLLKDFRSRFAHVVVSGGGWCADSVAWGQACERTMPVIQLGVTLIAQAEQKVRMLCHAGVTTTSCVVID